MAEEYKNFGTNTSTPMKMGIDEISKPTESDESLTAPKNAIITGA